MQTTPCWTSLISPPYSREPGITGTTATALVDHSLPPSPPCSWEPGPYGYHGDDGHKFGGNGKGEDYGPKFSKGDTVGACYHLGKQEIFFT